MVLVVACSVDGQATTATATTTPDSSGSGSATLPGSTATGPIQPNQGDLAGWDVVEIEIGPGRHLVALADEPTERSRGLMGIDDLGELAGMLFVFPAQSRGGFWMKDTLIRLAIGFFDDRGALVDTFVMEPCAADPCPVYEASGPFRYAVEMPAAGGSEIVAAGALVIDGAG